jgi:DNA ligase (NAD+)
MATSPAEEVAALREKLVRWASAYFEQDEPVVPDSDYDAAMQQLQRLEREHPELADPDSPSQRSGLRAAECF